MSKFFVAVLLSGLAWVAQAVEVGLVTQVSGRVNLQAEKNLPGKLQPFIKLRPGDRLILDESARLQIVYFDGGRQETWQGVGKLKVGEQASTVTAGKLQPAVKELPRILVKQIAKTPGPDGNVKAGMIRMRSIPGSSSLESVEKTYAELKAQAEASDLNPEIYLLSSYFELQEYDKVESLLSDMSRKSPADMEVKVLASLYKRAINKARTAQN